MHTIPWRWKVDTRLLLTLFLPAADVYTHTGGGTPQRVGRERSCVSIYYPVPLSTVALLAQTITRVHIWGVFYFFCPVNRRDKGWEPPRIGNWGVGSIYYDPFRRPAQQNHHQNTGSSRRSTTHVKRAIHLPGFLIWRNENLLYSLSFQQRKTGQQHLFSNAIFRSTATEITREWTEPRAAVN